MLEEAVALLAAHLPVILTLLLEPVGLVAVEEAAPAEALLWRALLILAVAAVEVSHPHLQMAALES